MNMKKPHEETWNANAKGAAMICNEDGHGQGVFMFDKDDRDRAMLAAQAPAMARVLLKVEWAGRQDYVGDGGYDCCSSCGGIAPENETMMDAVDDLRTGKTVVGHRTDCELAATLRAAGVLP